MGTIFGIVLLVLVFAKWKWKGIGYLFLSMILLSVCIGGPIFCIETHNQKNNQEYIMQQIEDVDTAEWTPEKAHDWAVRLHAWNNKGGMVEDMDQINEELFCLAIEAHAHNPNAWSEIDTNEEFRYITDSDFPPDPVQCTQSQSNYSKYSKTARLIRTLQPGATVNWDTYVEYGNRSVVEYSVKNAFGGLEQRRFACTWNGNTPSDASDEFLYFR